MNTFYNTKSNRHSLFSLNNNNKSEHKNIQLISKNTSLISENTNCLDSFNFSGNSTETAGSIAFGNDETMGSIALLFDCNIGGEYSASSTTAGTFSSFSGFSSTCSCSSSFSSSSSGGCFA